MVSFGDRPPSTIQADRRTTLKPRELKSRLSESAQLFNPDPNNFEQSIHREQSSLLSKRDTDREVFLKDLSERRATLDTHARPAVEALEQHIRELGNTDPDWINIDPLAKAKQVGSDQRGSRVRVLKAAMEPLLIVDGVTIRNHCMKAFEVLADLMQEADPSSLINTQGKMTSDNFISYITKIKTLNPKLFSPIVRAIKEGNESVHKKILLLIMHDKKEIFGQIQEDIQRSDRAGLLNHLVEGAEAIVLDELGRARGVLNSVRGHEEALGIVPGTPGGLKEINGESDRWESLINTTGELVSLTGTYEPTRRKTSI